MKVFKTIESDITKSGQSLSVFRKEFKNVYRDFMSAVSGIKENGTSQRAIVSLEKRKKRAQVIFFVPAEDVHHGSFFLPEILF